MTLPAGNLDRRIRLERATITQNALNEDIPTWGELATVWTSKLDVSDGERLAAAEVAAVISTRFRIRWSSLVASLNPKDRVVYPTSGGRIYDIVAVKEIGRREGLEISAMARADL